MAATLLSPEQLAGVYEKLKRADETIQNLNSEIITFLSKRPETGFSDDKQKAAQELAEFYAKLGIPFRFGVIAGEIAHHLRSSLEHIAWMLSSDQYRRDDPTGIAFPIFTKQPRTPKEIARYNRNIEGVASEDARALIERLQPYKATNPADDPLAILHELDREDKHHTLIIVMLAWDAKFSIPISTFNTFMIPSSLNKQMEQEGWLSLPLATKPKLEFTPQIAFAQIGGWKGEAVIPVLTHLLKVVKDDVGMFAELRI